MNPSLFSVKDIMFVVNQLLGDCKIVGPLSVSCQEHPQPGGIPGSSLPVSYWINVRGVATIKCSDLMAASHKAYSNIAGAFYEATQPLPDMGIQLTYPIIFFEDNIFIDQEKDSVTCNFGFSTTSDILLKLRDKLLEEAFETTMWS